MSGPVTTSFPPARVRLPAAVAIVVGTMVGTGIFGSLGYQLAATPSVFPVLLLWLVGGVLAGCGAVNYAELTAAFPRSGGEYHLLSRVYHPAAGFLSGWVSVTVGFPAPVAVCALFFGRYGAGALGWGDAAVLPLACGSIVTLTGLHLVSLSVGARSQTWLTVLKFALLAGLAAAGFLVNHPQPVSFAPAAGDGALLASIGWVTSIVFVLYAYTGWNAACYIADEVENPARIVPRALLLGTGLVTLLYLAVNAAFLYSAPIADMKGRDEVAFVAASSIFGGIGGRLTAALVALTLLSSISAMVWAGSRVLQVMGQDYPLLTPFARTGRGDGGVPRAGLIAQALLAIGMMLLANVEGIVTCTAFSLQLMTLLTVWGVVHLRWRNPALPRPFRAWGYPWTTVLFCVATTFVITFILWFQHRESLIGLANLTAGGAVYLVAGRRRAAE